MLNIIPGITLTIIEKKDSATKRIVETMPFRIELTKPLTLSFTMPPSLKLCGD